MFSIQARNLGKAYQTSNHAETLIDELRLLWRGTSKDTQQFWALRDVSFEVKSGEFVGIIGRNGAGKSTLLKILSGVTEPTQGEVTITGHVGSLLEVGIGFHPNLTGRENVFMCGGILGNSHRFIKERFDQIVEFSGVEKFLDTPIRYYSSGMAVRLGFAIAAHMDQNVLIIDEALAVGDAEFQQRCWLKLNELLRKGTTILFVSHNLGMLTECDRLIYLETGQVKSIGVPNDIIEQYLSETLSETESDKANATGVKHSPGVMIARQHSEVVITEAWQTSLESAAVEERACEFAISIESNSHVAQVNLLTRIYNENGLLLATALIKDKPFDIEPGKLNLRFKIQEVALAPGRYNAKLSLVIVANLRASDAIEHESPLAELFVSPLFHVEVGVGSDRKDVHPGLFLTAKLLDSQRESA